MPACLSDRDLTMLRADSGSPEQITAWNDHVAACDSCALRFARSGSAQSGANDREEDVQAESQATPEPDADETVTVKPVGKPNLDAGAASAPGDAIPGYQILKELHRGGQGVVYQAIQETTRRKVALKVMLEGPFAGPASKRRFEREIGRN